MTMQGEPVVYDMQQGIAWLNPSISLPVAYAGPNGEIQVGGSKGPILRPLTFGERTRVVGHAMVATHPQNAVAANVLHAATVRPGEGDRMALEMVSLSLAGAGQPKTPSFVEASLLVARVTGWSPDQIAGAEAAEVDRLARHIAPQDGGDGWNRILFATEPAVELAAKRREMADDLLRRAVAAPNPGPDQIEIRNQQSQIRNPKSKIQNHPSNLQPPISVREAAVLRRPQSTYPEETTAEFVATPDAAATTETTGRENRTRPARWVIRSVGFGDQAVRPDPPASIGLRPPATDRPVVDPASPLPPARPPLPARSLGPSAQHPAEANDGEQPGRSLEETGPALPVTGDNPAFFRPARQAIDPDDGLARQSRQSSATPQVTSPKVELSRWPSGSFARRPRPVAPQPEAGPALMPAAGPFESGAPQSPPVTFPNPGTDNRAAGHPSLGDSQEMGMEMADIIAALLHDEADLRGLDR